MTRITEGNTSMRRKEFVVIGDRRRSEERRIRMKRGCRCCPSYDLCWQECDGAKMWACSLQRKISKIATSSAKADVFVAAVDGGCTLFLADNYVCEIFWKY